MTGTTRLIIMFAVSGIILGGAALAFGLIAYSRTNSIIGGGTSQDTPHPANISKEDIVLVKPSSEGFEKVIHNSTGYFSVPLQSTASPLNCGNLTGNLSVYLILITKSEYFSASGVLQLIQDKVGKIEASSCGIQYGASRGGQYAQETVMLTEDNMTPDQKLDGAKPGDIASVRMIKKPAETVKFFIDPAIKKADGSPVTKEDFALDYDFGNGATCCGIELADGQHFAGVAIVVVDESFDGVMTEKFPSIKEA